MQDFDGVAIEEGDDWDSKPCTDSKTGVKFEDYAATWLERIRHTRKFSTWFGYDRMLTRELLPAFRGCDLDDITREKIKVLACTKLKLGQRPKTVQNMIRGLSSLLSHAVEDNLLTVNPALKPGKFLPPVSKRRGINPLTRTEVDTFLTAVQHHAPAIIRYFSVPSELGCGWGS